MNIERVRHMYFLGIGGIGMSALARYFSKKGVEVSGYDKMSTALTDQLLDEGIRIHFEDDPEMIPSNTEMVIYTPAVPSDMKEFISIKERKIPLYKRSQILGELTKNKFTIAVAGTHGKTTITSILAHILVKAGVNVAAFIGGIVNVYKTNFIGEVDADVWVVEADEYDRSFLTLKPDMALISAIDEDHLDIYGAKKQLYESFELFVKNLTDDGKLVLKNSLVSFIDHPNTYTYSLLDKTENKCSALNIKDGSYIFNLQIMDDQINEVKFGYPGRHNVENAVGAAALAALYGLTPGQIKRGLETYPGVKRRFELILKNENVIYIDDYAHHPEELKACILSVKELYPDKKIMGIFQPHLYSRTRDLAEDFARSLELLDEIILMDIYPAREKSIPGIDATYLLEKINHDNKQYLKTEEILSHVKNKNPELLLTLGAGDIDQIVEPLKKCLKEL